MRLSRVLPALIVFVLVAAGIGYRVGIFDAFMKPVVVAVIDTGVDTRIPAIASRLHGEPGYNFFDGNNDVSDASGHGTKVALMVVQNCGKCRILPLKVSKSGAGATAKEVAAAIRYAFDKGARVINVSFGMSQGSPDLEVALGEAKAKGVAVVTAAGTGLSNPFRPDELEKVYPQAYPDVTVVGVARSFDETDMLMNFGDLLDVVVTGQPIETFSSSLASGTVSGFVAQKLSSFRRYEPTQIRALLRETSKVPALPADLALTPALTRIGFGGFDAEEFLRSGSPSKAIVRIYGVDDGSRAQLEVSSIESIKDSAVEVHCAKTPDKPTVTNASSAAGLLKGRARFTVERPNVEVSLKGCVAKIRLDHPGGSAKTIEATL